MDKNKKLEYITNGLQAAHKIQKAYHSSVREDSSASVRQSRLSLINNMLQIISEHSPDKHKDVLNRAISTSNLYNDTYRGLKNHLMTSRSEKLNKENFVKALSILKPVLNPPNQLMVERIMKLYEIFS